MFIEKAKRKVKMYIFVIFIVNLLGKFNNVRFHISFFKFVMNWKLYFRKKATNDRNTIQKRNSIQ